MGKSNTGFFYFRISFDFLHFIFHMISYSIPFYSLEFSILISSFPLSFSRFQNIFRFLSFHIHLNFQYLSIRFLCVFDSYSFASLNFFVSLSLFCETSSFFYWVPESSFFWLVALKAHFFYWVPESSFFLLGSKGSSI